MAGATQNRRKAGAVAPVCPCGGTAYASCCGPYHLGAIPGGAEQLMRARYSSYAMGLPDFLHRTWDERTRPSLAELQCDEPGKWLGLEVRRHVVLGDQASVEFIALHKVGGRMHRLHEISRFVREQGQWFYVDGSFPERK